MNTTYLDAIADHGGSLITHIGLVDDQGAELTGGDYARQAVSWTSADDGTIRPSADLSFSVPGDATVAGWRGYSAASGGTEYGGADFETQETFGAPGTVTLIAAETAIHHDAPSE